MSSKESGRVMTVCVVIIARIARRELEDIGCMMREVERLELVRDQLVKL